MSRLTAPPLLVVENFAPSVGGVETFNRALLSAWADRVDAGSDRAGTILIAPESRAWIEREAPAIARAFTIPELPTGRTALLDAALAQIASNEPPSAVAILRASKRLSPILVKAQRAGIPSVVYVHGRTSTFDRWPPRFWWRKRTQMHRATRVATNSEWMAKNLEKVGHPRAQVDVIPLGIDPERFSPDPVRRAWERDSASLGDAPLLVTVSRLVGAKGHGRVLEAVHALLPEFPNLRWWIVGDGPSRAELEEMIETAGVEHAVKLLGSLPDPTGPLSAADLFVLLAEDEAFGLAALEAEAMGVPALVLAGSGLEEIVRDGVTGSVLPRDPVAIREGLRAWIEDRARREKAGTAARTLAAGYTWERTTDRFISLLESVRVDR